MYNLGVKPFSVRGDRLYTLESDVAYTDVHV